MSRRLRLRFDDPAAFRKEYRENIVQGGAFIRTEQEFSLRESVVVEVELTFAGATSELDAEIVHCVSAEDAGEAGAGVAVQFLVPAPELRDRFEQYLPRNGRSEAAPPLRASAKLETSRATFDGSDLPIGKSARPTRARREEGEGTVSSVASESEGAAEADSGRIAGGARVLEARRRARGIAGSIEELGMGNLVQIFGKFSRAGTLTAASGGEQGVVSFEGGALRHCRLGSLTGTKALARLLSWERGHFEFHSELDPLPDESSAIPLEAALLEAARQFDEMRRVEPATLDPGARLCLDPKVLAAQSEALTKTEEAVVDLAAANLSVRRLLDVIPESDVQILEAIRSLAERGIVEILPGDE